MINILDYGIGNLGSIANMFKKVGVEAKIIKSEQELEAADKILLPGVGSFDRAMQNLKAKNLIEPLNRKALTEKVPVLGICLGMQLLTNGSEEGTEQGFGWIDAEVKRFPKGKLKVPHMGWNRVQIKQQHPIFKDMYEEPRFYFVHSYYCQSSNDSNILTTTNFGVDFVSSIVSENIIGMQYHPEKSHKFGMRVFENFAKL